MITLAELGRGFGIHVVVSQNDWIYGQSQGLKTIANARVELKLNDPSYTAMEREAAKRTFELNLPLFGCTEPRSPTSPDENCWWACPRSATRRRVSVGMPRRPPRW